MVKIKSEIFNGNICISLFLITLLVMSVLCSFTMTTIAGEVFELAMQDYMATSTLYYQTSEELCDLVKEMSNGRLIINLYAPGTIVPAYEITKAVNNGSLDLGVTCAGMDAGVLGMASFLVSQCNVPAGQGPMEAMAWYNVGDGLKYANKVWNTKFDVEVLGSLCNAPAELLYHSNVKIKEIEDFKGIKFRTFGLWAKVLSGFGASVVSVPGGEIYSSIDRGVIDAVEYCGPASDWMMGFHEVSKYIGVPGIHAPSSGSVLIANRKVWDKLPDDLKSILKNAIEVCNARFYQKTMYESGIAMQKYIDYGNEVITLSEDAQKKILEASINLLDSYAAEDPLFDEIYRNQIEFSKNWNRYSNPEVTPQYSVLMSKN